MTGSEETPVTVTSTGLAVGGVKARPSDWLVIRVAALALDDPAGPAAQAARLLADSGYLVPLPRPITATWTGDDEERTRRVLAQVGASVEEIAMLTDGRYLCDVPEDEGWRMLTEIPAANARIEAIFTRVEASLTLMAKKVDAAIARTEERSQRD